MKKYILIIIIFFVTQLTYADGVPQISLSPNNGYVIEGGINGSGKTINISYNVSNLESCWSRGKWTGFEVWLYIDGNEVAYYRDPERPAFFTYYALKYSNSLNHYFSQGTHTIQVRAKSFEVKYDLYLDIDESSTTNTIQIIPPPRITADNNFTDASEVTHGLITVSSHSTQTAPFIFEINSGQNISLTAISPQTDNQNYQMIWHTGTVNASKWRRNGDSFLPDQSVTFTVSSNDNNAIYQAQLRKICNITFQNNYIGVGNGGVITVNGSQYNSPTSSFQVVEQNPITAEANTYYYNNGIIYTFKQWNDGNTSYNRTFNPSENTTYTAQFQGKPENEFISFGNAVGEPIVINWTDNPNTNVTQYQIWRIVKHNGITGPATQIATVSRGVQTYTDYDYILTSSYTHDLLQYDVRAYYSTEGTYSDED
ncbi:MAG: hypothetical protein ACOYU5_06000, partial [Stygiobacter sp.]